MKLLERLFHSKATPEETVVSDEYIKKYPEPSEKVQELLQRVPDTGKMLYQYIRHTSLSTTFIFGKTVPMKLIS